MVTPSSINGALERGEIPKAWLYQVAYETGYSVEWLQIGDGERTVGKSQVEGRRTEAAPDLEMGHLLKEPRIKAVVKTMGGLSLSGKDAVLQCTQAIKHVEETTRKAGRRL